MKHTIEEIASEQAALHWLRTHPYAPKVEPELLLNATDVWLKLGDSVEAPSASIRRQLIDSLWERRIPHCHICGCTDGFACPGGCSWSAADPTVCTACARKETR
jgi:hypothetical protein